MSFESEDFTTHVTSKVVHDSEVKRNELRHLSNTGSRVEVSSANTTKTLSYDSSSLDASRSNLRLKLNGGTATSGLVFPNGRSSTKIPSLLQELPYSKALSTNKASVTSAVSLSALPGIQKGSESEGIGVKEEKLASVNSLSTTSIDLDAIDIDNITIKDLNRFKAADGDTLRAKYLNKLSRKERDHVLQDIHGVADVMEESAFVDESLKNLEVEIERELLVRKSKIFIGKNECGERNEVCHDNRYKREVSEAKSVSESGTPTKFPALEKQLGKLQEKLDDLVRQRNNLDQGINRDSDFPPRKQLQAKNHPMFGKLGDFGRLGSFHLCSNSISSIKSESHNRPTPVPSSCFGGSSTLIGLNKVSMLNSNEAQHDVAILKNKDAIAYEQALAQCRGRRRERNNSLFRPNLSNENFDEGDELDEGLYIDVEGREFRVSFLRAERYDVRKAAIRILEYFEEKRKLFGVGNLTTKIKLKNLDPVTRRSLESGHIQLLPGRDRAGRAVIIETKKLATNGKQHQDNNCILRAFWILCSIALENVETETNGFVFVKYAVGGSRENSNDRFHRRICDWGNVLRALPLRVASIHWCVDNQVLKQEAILSALMLGGSNFVRVRCHAGTDTEVQYDLMTFGIPTNLFPVSRTGKIDLSCHHMFLRRRKKTEASTLLNKALALVEAPMLDECMALTGFEDPATPVVATTSAAHLFPTNETGYTQLSDDFHRSNGTLYETERPERAADFGFNNKSNDNNGFCFIGSYNQIQVQPSTEQQLQQHKLHSFQQQHLGMNMDMVSQFTQSQQIRRHNHHHNKSITAESKSGIAYSMEPVLVPGELDILLGRGRGAQNHKGNIHYRQVVETFRSRYEQIPQKGAKTQLIREVVAVIYDNGGRFLKQDGFGRWVPVDPEVARDKVSHSFRNQKRLSTVVSSVSNTESSPVKKRPRNDMKLNSCLP